MEQTLLTLGERIVGIQVNMLKMVAIESNGYFVCKIVKIIWS